ncbi:hypothetical protein ACFWDN_21325 [Micromonospora chalcea]
MSWSGYVPGDLLRSPADDCGVTGGCRACPLFAANVCGDPAPEPCATLPTELPGMWEPADFLGGAPDEVRPPVTGRGDNGHGVRLVEDPALNGLNYGVLVGPAPEPLVTCQYDTAPHPMNDECTNVYATAATTARFEVGADGVAVDREAEQLRQAADLLAWLTRPADDLTALAEATGVLVDPDAPDVDPAEPKPEGVGCCGGKCASPC